MGYCIHKCFSLQHFKSGTHLTLTSANAIRNSSTGLFCLTGQSQADRALPALGYLPLTCFSFPFYKATVLLKSHSEIRPQRVCVFLSMTRKTLPILLPVTELQCLEGVLGVHSDDGDGAASKSFPSLKSLPELLGTGLLGACWVRTCLCASGCVSISLCVTGTHGTLAEGLGIKLLPSQGLMGTQ